jgi:3D (Asp-Asp-Asp) domain-containing protein
MMIWLTWAVLLVIGAYIWFFAIKGCADTVAYAEVSGTMRVTAYCPCSKCCGRWASVTPRRTASGHIIKANDRFVAAPKSIPFGTILSVPGYGTVPVLDRGGAIKSGRLDVYFPTHAEALKWGVKVLTVRVYKKG